MCKELSEMTLEELWEMFPIVLKVHNSDYGQWYLEEVEVIQTVIEDSVIYRLSHIGSSAVQGLVSKPTVDILLELNEEEDMDDVCHKLLKVGWLKMGEQNDPYRSIYLNKGYTVHGFDEKVFHLHIRAAGDWHELYFRDYLIEHKDVADAYGEMKLSLMKEFRKNRDGYTEAKSDFIKKITVAARMAYPGRYEVR